MITLTAVHAYTGEPTIITNSELELTKYPYLNEAGIFNFMMKLAEEYVARGFNVTIEHKD